jgi:hypothetical protein
MTTEDYIPTVQDKSFDAIDIKEGYHSSNSESPPLDDFNGWADFWRYRIGVNVIPADTRNKVTYQRWSEWQSKAIPEEQHNKWKDENAFSKGIAIIPGKVWHREDKKGQYFIFIDADKLKAITEISTRKGNKTTSLNEMSQKFLIEQHKDNPDKAHIYFYSPLPFPQKTADSILGLEVKGLGEHGIAFCSPSIHKNGMPYEIIGNYQPVALTSEQATELIQHIDQICIKYGLQYIGKDFTSSNINNVSSNNNKLRNIIKTLDIDTNVKIPQGQRHLTLISAANSLLFNHLGKGKNKRTEKQLKEFFERINYLLCDPEPLPDSEINSIWNSAIDFVLRIRKEEQKEREDNDDKEERENILELVEENCSEFFLDQYGLPYAAVRINGHIETMSLHSKRFRNWLCKLSYDSTDKLLKAEDLTTVSNILKAKAEFGGNIKQLYLRIGVDSDGNYYYDLTNSSWKVVKITGTEWHIEKRAPVVFRRYSNQQPQLYPARDYSHDIFDRFMNLINIKDEDNKLLLKCYTIALFVPEIPKPILMLHGEQGSAKSTLQELIKMLVDPSIIRTLSFPRDINELIQQLSHNHVNYFDNISNIKDWHSDQLCRAVTGSGFSKRQLWTDDDDIIYSFKRCIGFNGINLGATKADLLDRGLIIQLERIPEEKRRKIEEIWKEFEKIKPQLLGYIFDILVQVIKKRKEGGIEIKSHPRMADFAEVAEIISRCMGYPENKFLAAYHKNIGLQTQQALEASPIATAIMQFMNSRTKWEGTATKLLDELEPVAESLKIKTKNNRLWPSTPNVVSCRLNEVKTNLREIGITIERPVDTITNTRKIEIRKISPEHPVSPEDPNQAQLRLENSGDIAGDINSISPGISPPTNSENQAQNSSSGDTGDTGDIIHTSLLQ